MGRPRAEFAELPKYEEIIKYVLLWTLYKLGMMITPPSRATIYFIIVFVPRFILVILPGFY